MQKIVVFQLEKQQYGVNIKQVNSIERILDITKIPKAPNFIKGVIHLRGGIIPIIDLKERLKFGATEFKEQTRLIIVGIKNLQVGLLVDSATDVLDIDNSVIDSPSGLIEDDEQSFLKGVAKLGDDLLILLDLKNILVSNEISKVKEIVEE